MVLLVVKCNVHPDKLEAYTKWTEGAIKTTTGTPGVVEFRAYRTATGPAQVVTTYEFADFAAWAAWYASAGVQRVFTEMHTVAVDVDADLWGPSPMVPAPIRPQN